MFRKAVKQEAKLRLAIAGPSGSGKTYTSLAIATALGGPVAVVDTEHGSASKYADVFDFDTLRLTPPYHPDRFVEAIEAAASEGYNVVVLDSLSHAWNGTGGLLEIVDQIAIRMKTSNTYAAWKDATPLQNRLVEAILRADLHVIATMRSKQDYVQEQDDRGRTRIRKLGMAPVQRDGFEYEFDVFMDMDMDNNGIIGKTRCPALTNRVFAKPGADIAGILSEWLAGEPAPVRQAQEKQPSIPPVDPKLDKALAEMNRFGIQYYGEEGWPVTLQSIKDHYGITQIDLDHAVKIANHVQKRLAERKAQGQKAVTEKRNGGVQSAGAAAQDALAKLAKNNPGSTHAQPDAEPA